MTSQELSIRSAKHSPKNFRTKPNFAEEMSYAISAIDLRDIARFCRDQLLFDYLLDITSIDNFGEEPRFRIVYHLYSMPQGVHLRLKLNIPGRAECGRHGFGHLADCELA